VVLLLSSAVLSRESDPDGELREAYAELVEKYGVTVCLCEETPHP
jgi:hypothetical protein